MANRKIILFLISTFVGIGLFLPSITLFFISCSITIFLINRYIDVNKENTYSITSIFILGTGLRFISLFAAHIINFLITSYHKLLIREFVWSDELLYWTKISYILKFGINAIDWGNSTSVPSSGYGINSYVYIISYILTIINPFAEVNVLLFMRLFNVFLGGLSILIIYSLTKELFCEKTAYISSLCFALYPSAIIWASGGLKDSLIQFCILFIFLAIVKGYKQVSIYYICGMAISILGLYYVNKTAAVLILLVAWFSLFVSLKNHTVLKYCFIFLSLFVLSIICYKNAKQIDIKFKNFLYATISRQIAQAKADSAGYNIYYELPSVQYDYRVYPKHLPPKTKKIYYNYKDIPFDTYISYLDINWMMFVFSYAKGLFYTLFSPFLWDINSPLQLAAYPQMAIIYLLYPFCVLGLLSGIRFIEPGKILPLYIFLIIIISIYAFSEGNIGGLFRHRDWIVPFFFIFSSAGIVSFFRKV